MAIGRGDYNGSRLPEWFSGLIFADWFDEAES